MLTASTNPQSNPSMFFNWSFRTAPFPLNWTSQNVKTFWMSQNVKTFWTSVPERKSVLNVPDVKTFWTQPCCALLPLKVQTINIRNNMQHNSYVHITNVMELYRVDPLVLSVLLNDSLSPPVPSSTFSPFVNSTVTASHFFSSNILIKPFIWSEDIYYAGVKFSLIHYNRILHPRHTRSAFICDFNETLLAQARWHCPGRL